MRYEDDDAANAAYSSGMRYQIKVGFTHRQIDREAVSKATAWVGSPIDRAHPNTWSFVVERRGHRLFFRQLVEVLDHVHERQSFVADFIASGGAVEFIIRLYGRRNIGDVLRADELMRMGRMGIVLRIEVAPEWT